MDLQSEIARLVIEKGGSIVQANPEEEGSENITSILIDDKVYKISIEGIGDLERRIETVETDKADELTMNTGINISDWDRDIDPDVPVIVDKYTNYHDAVSKISQQIDVMGNRTDDLKTSLNAKAQGRSVTLNNHSSKTIKFKNYNTCAFITAGNSFYVYNYGYLFTIKSENNINVTLASDYVTITVDNTTNTNYYLGIVVMNDIEYIIS